MGIEAKHKPVRATSMAQTPIPIQSSPGAEYPRRQYKHHQWGTTETGLN